jgi:Outer membrane protein beta-barrel domain
MKKCLQAILFFCLFVSATLSQAQITMGVRAGINVATYHYNYGPKFPAVAQTQPSSSTLLTFGVPVEMRLSSLFALQMELNFIQKGQQSQSDQTIQNIRIVSDSKLVVNWLELPILAKVKFGSDVGIGGGLFFGPSIGYGLSGKSKGSFSTTTNGTSSVTVSNKSLEFKKDEHSQVDFALNFGGEVNYGGVFFDMRYQLGLTNMVTNSGTTNGLDLTVQTRGLAVSLGYRMPIGSSEKTPSKTKKK